MEQGGFSIKVRLRISERAKSEEFEVEPVIETLPHRIRRSPRRLFHRAGV